jgi:hypothetical protein
MQTFAAGDAREETFTTLAALLFRDRKAADLQALCAVHQAHAPEDPELFYYQALAKLLEKRPAEAAPFLRKAFEKETAEHRRRAYLTDFLHEMEGQGLALDGYRAAPDRTAAFEMLAAMLIDRKKDKELAALVEEHGRGGAGDPLLGYYRGELYLLRGEAEKAEKEFAGYAAKAPPEEQWRAGLGLRRARVKAGKAAEACREGKGELDVFEALAFLCLQEKDARQLQGLIDAQRKARPDTVSLAVLELEVRWLTKDWQGVLMLLDENPGDVFFMPQYLGKAEDYRVRSLVRLKRTADAVREAEAVKQRRGPWVGLVLAHASTGDVRRTMAVVESLPSRSWLLGPCYQDPDLGPLLRSEAFRSFREKFPEPKEEAGREDLDDDD